MQRPVAELDHGPWPNCEKVSVGGPKLDHPLDVSLREPLLLRQFILQVRCQPGNAPRTPAFSFLAGGDQATDVPEEANQLRIRGEGGAVLGLTDPAFDVAEEIAVEAEFRLFHELESCANVQWVRLQIVIRSNLTFAVHVQRHSLALKIPKGSVFDDGLVRRTSVF